MMVVAVIALAFVPLFVLWYVPRMVGQIHLRRRFVAGFNTVAAAGKPWFTLEDRHAYWRQMVSLGLLSDHAAMTEPQTNHMYLDSLRMCDDAEKALADAVAVLELMVLVDRKARPIQFNPSPWLARERRRLLDARRMRDDIIGWYAASPYSPQSLSFDMTPDPDQVFDK